ncbi:MAG: hypothetical protein K8T10_02045 [Candidatus Eremiobacteraeota bacterium]|nr:hypothetical protein [Candidatus Eremiobacteraeota bacterium]
MTIYRHTKQELIDLVRQIPEEEFQTAFRFLEFLASLPGEPPLTDEEKAESSENWQAILRGEGIPWEEVREELADE